MNFRLKKPALWMILWITVSCLPLAAQAAARPKLIVLIVVDQLRADYLSRFEPYFLPSNTKKPSSAGFRLLMDHGAYFKNARTAHALNTTAIGHAAIMTGGYSYLHGIVSNHWFDSEKGSVRYCVQDDANMIVSSKPVKNEYAVALTGLSPKNLLATTFADELKNATAGRSKIAAIALKDRSAIIMGGHRADLTIWYDDDSAAWQTSSFYLGTNPFPKWLERWNQVDYASTQAPKLWSKLLPENYYRNASALPESLVSSAQGLGKTFPHPIDGNAKRLVITPWGNDYVFETAKKAVQELKLGQSDVTDFLAIGVSSFDLTGHNYGPLSAESQDAILRLDRTMARFFGQLDVLVPGGLKETMIVLTSDHGVTLNPNYATELKLPGGAYFGKQMIEKSNAYLRKIYSFDDDEKPVSFFYESNVWLNRSLLEKHKLTVGAVARKLVEWVRNEEFVAAAYTAQDLLDGKIPPTSIASKMARAVHPLRSGDVVYATRPGYVQMKYAEGTAHEGPNAQDASVPILFWGKSFKAIRTFEEATLNDIAATVSAVLGIAPPSGSEGQVLSSAIKPSTL